MCRVSSNQTELSLTFQRPCLQSPIAPRTTVLSALNNFIHYHIMFKSTYFLKYTLFLEQFNFKEKLNEKYRAFPYTYPSLTPHIQLPLYQHHPPEWDIGYNR